VSAKAALVGAAVACFVLAGCAGGGEGEAETSTSAITPAPSTNGVRVYFLREGRVWPARRVVPADVAQANAALDELLIGPTAQEEAELGWTTALPADVETYSLLAPAGQRGAVSLEIDGPLTRAARAQIVFTLTQFPLIEAVVLNDNTYRRADFERHTPSVLVESPLAFDDVSSPLHAFGTANAFEATFSYELTDTDGRIVDEDFVTATSGTGTRGAFEFVTDTYDVPFDGVGSLIVFELSAEDGSRINVVEIPVRMSK
jgi:Immunoglobulin-like domain of bacterial spore germination/Sporulation and spore germination